MEAQRADTAMVDGGAAGSVAAHGAASALRVLAMYAVGAGVAWAAKLALGWHAVAAVLVGAGVLLVLMLRWGRGGVASRQGAGQRAGQEAGQAPGTGGRARRATVLEVVAHGVGALALISVLLRDAPWMQVLGFVAAPALIIAGSRLVRAGVPRRVGTQRVCKFCSYEYTFGYPPETDPAAPHRCPECGKGWLADLAVGVKRSRPWALGAGVVCIAMGFSIFVAPVWSARLLGHLPTPALRAIALGGGASSSKAWAELAPRLANFSAAQHEDLFVRLLALRRASRFGISREMHAYMQEQVGAMPAAVRERYYRETFALTVTREPSLATGASRGTERTLLSIETEDRDYLLQTLLSLRAVTAGDAELPVRVEEAWSGMHENGQFAEVLMTRDRLVVSVPRTDGPIMVRFTAVVVTQPWTPTGLSMRVPPGAVWSEDVSVEVPAVR